MWVAMTPTHSVWCRLLPCQRDLANKEKGFTSWQKGSIQKVTCSKHKLMIKPLVQRRRWSSCTRLLMILYVCSTCWFKFTYKRHFSLVFTWLNGAASNRSHETFSNRNWQFDKDMWCAFMWIICQTSLGGCKVNEMSHVTKLSIWEWGNLSCRAWIVYKDLNIFSHNWFFLKLSTFVYYIPIIPIKSHSCHVEALECNRVWSPDLLPSTFNYLH